MSAAHTAAIAPLKTPRRIGESVARASQAFELDAAAVHRQPSLPVSGWCARGALAIDVPRIMAASPRGWSLAATVVERDAGPGIVLRPAPTGKAVR